MTQRSDGAESNRARSGPGPVQLGLGFVLAGLGILALVAAYALYGLYQRGARMMDETGAALGRVQSQPTPTIVTQAVLLQRLSGANALTTAVFTMETVIDQSQDRTLAGIVIGQTRLLYIAHGDVRAGVDLARLGAEDVSVAGDAVTVRLPPPEILDRKIDVAKSRVYDFDQSLFGPVDPEMQTRAERFALDKIVRGACEAGILDEANRRAAFAVQALLTTGGVRDVRVETRPPAADECPVGGAVDAGVPTGPVP